MWRFFIYHFYLRSKYISSELILEINKEKAPKIMQMSRLTESYMFYQNWYELNLLIIIFLIKNSKFLLIFFKNFFFSSIINNLNSKVVEYLFDITYMHMIF